MATSHNLLRLCLQRPLVAVVTFALVTSFTYVILQNATGYDSDDQSSTYQPTRQGYVASEYDDRFDKEMADGLKQDIKSLVTRVEDLWRIKASVSNELKLMQREKTKILRDKASLLSKSEKILAQIEKGKAQLRQLELDLSANKRQSSEKICNDVSIAPIIFNPLVSLNMSNYSITLGGNQNIFTNDDILADSQKLNFQKCGLTKEFKFNLLNQPEQKITDDVHSFKQSIEAHDQYIDDREGVCLTVILANNLEIDPNYIDGNNIVINLSGQPIDRPSQSIVGKNSLIASPSFRRNTFRHRVDLVIPSNLQAPANYESIIGSMPLQSPLDRKYFASYFGMGDQSAGDKSTYELTTIDRTLQTIHRSSIDDMFLFIYNCGPNTNQQCYDEREKMIELSTFLIIVPHERYDIDRNANDLIYLALARGTIPVIVGRERINLPFDEVLDWRRASILVPTARLPEIHFILRSLSPGDIYSLKYYGRHIFENHLATTQQIVSTIISVISLERLNYPPPPVSGVKTQTYYDSHELKLDVDCTLSMCQEAKSDSMMSLISTEVLGPREAPFASPTYRRNFSLALTQTYDLWNNPLHSPFHLKPSLPIDPIPPSEFKFLSNNQGYRPIADGQGGSGQEFSQALGGDYPNEQFTIVILTYERIALLMKTLERLKRMAYLHKILVVWNSVNQRPHESLVWPDVGVPIVLVKVEKNSLNNRFLPYDAIQTDAIFSMDDDSPLRPDEIVFAFRVWRQSRDRIVGFPGRFHAWNEAQNSWMYNSNHSCELSMVLTGGAFFHKYYTFAYSQLMPESIRSIVDKFMNCEDIAMNFLVAHLTRKPPIKVTSRWTFHCATCPTSLSEDDTHFMERHECLNIFMSIYGYMPLLNTQHRSDSILFKTRLPRDKQKCFKFV